MRNIPDPYQRWSMPLWAGIFYALVPSARRAAERNLEQVLGPASALGARLRSFRLFVNYAQSITNGYRLHIGRGLPGETEYHGRENLLGVRASGRGAIVVTGHLGAWHIAPFLVQKRDLPPMTLAMAEEPNAELAEFERGFRSRFRIVYTTGSPFSTLELARTLRRRELVGMQLDRHLGGSHLMLPFCGRPAPFPVGPAMLARATGCPLVPIFVVSTEHRKRYRFFVEPPIEVEHTRDRAADVERAMRQAVGVYERYVRTYPHQWFNFYDFWSAPPSP